MPRPRRSAIRRYNVRVSESSEALRPGRISRNLFLISVMPREANQSFGGFARVAIACFFGIQLDLRTSPEAPLGLTPMGDCGGSACPRFSFLSTDGHRS